MTDRHVDAANHKYCHECGRELPAEAHFCASCGTAQEDEIEPVPAAAPAAPTAEQAIAASTSSAPTAGEEDEAGPWRRRLAVVGGALVVVLAAAGIAFGVVNQFVGDRFATAAYYPEDTYVYAGADLLQARDYDRLERFVETLADTFQDVDFDFEFANLENLDQLGVDIEDDIVPWIGRSMSIGAFDAVGDEPDIDVIGATSSLIAVSVRDRALAERFSEDVLEDLSDLNDFDLDTVRVADARGWEFGVVENGTGVVWVVFDDVLLVGSSVEAVEVGLENTAATNLLGAEAFGAFESVIPADALVASYVSGPFVADLVDDAFRSAFVDAGVRNATEPMETVTVYASSASVLDDGIRATFSVVVKGDDVVPTVTGEVGVADRLPSDTAAFLAWNVEPGALADAGPSLEDWDARVYDDVVDVVDDLLGFDPFVDVLPHIGGPSFMALLGDRRVDGASLGVNDVGGVLGIGITDREPIEQALSDVMEVAEDEGAEVERDGETYYVDLDGEELVIAVADDLVVAGVPGDAVDDVLTGSGASLRSESPFRRVDDALSVPVMMYVDLLAIADIAELDRDDARMMETLPVIGAGWSFGGRTTTFEFFVAIEY